MNKIAKFEKVSYEQFEKDFMNCKDPAVVISKEEIRNIYDNIKLPKRATTGSAGYDFFIPYPIHLTIKDTERIPTGIRVKIEDGWVLQLFPRSGLGFKYRLQLDNTVGIIDADYYNSKNEGHIMAKITNDSIRQDEDDFWRKECVLESGEGFMQGIFLPFGITEDDNTDGIRDGGFGSTTKKGN